MAIKPQLLIGHPLHAGLMVKWQYFACARCCMVLHECLTAARDQGGTHVAARNGWQLLKCLCAVQSCIQGSLHQRPEAAWHQFRCRAVSFQRLLCSTAQHSTCPLLILAYLGGAEAPTPLPALVEVYASKLFHLLCSACLGESVAFADRPALMKLWATKASTYFVPPAWVEDRLSYPCQRA